MALKLSLIKFYITIHVYSCYKHSSSLHATTTADTNL